MNFIMNTEIVTYIIKIFFISICTYYTCFKITNLKISINVKSILILILITIVSFICGIIKYYTDSFYSILFLTLSFSGLFSAITKYNIGHSILITLISLSINFITFIVATSIIFISFSIFINIESMNKYLIFIMLIDILLIYLFSKIKKFKYGFSFLQKEMQNDYIDILILNISVTILFSTIILNNFNLLSTSKLFFGFILFSIVMFITIKESITLYYKHKLLVQNLEDTEKALNESKDKIEELEKENLNFSKTSHSIAHKQKALEYQLNQLLNKCEFSDELDVSHKLKNLSKECFTNTSVVELSKTNIEKIDNMLNFLQSECVKNNIDFELFLNGNIHYIINNLISENELEILIADLVKNAIIAINNSNNINRSILVKLGIFDDSYCLSVYDSGIEFKVETLQSLGLKPCSTHLDSGGSGMGFMNIFDTLKNCKASFIIKEISSPSKDNYTKCITVKLDKKSIYIISSYRFELLNKCPFSNNFIVSKE